VHREFLISPITRTLQRDGMYPLLNIQKAIENGDLSWIYPLKIVIFHSYVSLPESTKWQHTGVDGVNWPSMRLCALKYWWIVHWIGPYRPEFQNKALFALPILDTLQKIKFFAGERRYSH